MNIYLTNQKNNKPSSFVSSGDQRKKTATSLPKITDNRPETVSQRKLKNIANNSNQQKTAAQLKTISNGTVQLKPNGNHVVQRQEGMENELGMEKMRKRYKKTRSKLHPLTKVPKEKIVEDAIKVRAMLRNMEGVVKPALRQLEQDILAQHETSSAKKPNTRHLTRALAVREKQGGLNPTRANYTRLLSAEDFTREAAKGALFNDWGALTAALTHGEFTHRIQWYVLLYAMSNGFKDDIASAPADGFYHTPKDLLVAINLGGVTIEQPEIGNSGFRPTKQKDGHTLWDVLFDRAALGRGSEDYRNKEIGISDPERFMLMLDTQDDTNAGKLKGLVGLLKEDAPELSRILTKRHMLRKRQGNPRERLGGLNPEDFERRKEQTGRYKLEGRGLLMRNEPQSLVGSKARNQKYVPYAPSVEIYNESKINPDDNE